MPAQWPRFSAGGERGMGPKHCALCLTLLLACLAHTVLAAEPERHLLQIPAQQLAPALQELARQSGSQIIFFSGVAEGRQARELQGRYTIGEALTALLADSGLKFQ